MRRLTSTELEEIKEELLFHAYDKKVELICCKLLNLEIVGKRNQKGYDIEDKYTGERYKVKTRINEITDSTSFDNIKPTYFEWLLCVFLNENRDITHIFKVNHDFVVNNLGRRDRFRWNDKIRNNSNVIELT